MPIFITDPSNQTGRPARVAEAMRGRVGPTQILIVDHDAAVRDALSLTLRACGFDVGAYDCAEDLRRGLPEHRACCLLIEFDLEDVTGIELLMQLRAEGIELPAVIMSARLRSPVIDAPERTNVAAVLQKPFGQEALLRSLGHALARSYPAATISETT